jgi:hypothetical protein
MSLVLALCFSGMKNLVPQLGYKLLGLEDTKNLTLALKGT